VKNGAISSKRESEGEEVGGKIKQRISRMNTVRRLDPTARLRKRRKGGAPITLKKKESVVTERKQLGGRGGVQLGPNKASLHHYLEGKSKFLSGRVGAHPDSSI